MALQAGDRVQLAGQVIRVHSETATVQLADGQAIQVGHEHVLGAENKSMASPAKKVVHGSVRLSE